VPALTPNGFQPETRSPSSRRADFDLVRRLATLEGTVAELSRVVGILASVVTVSTYVAFSFNANTTEPIVGNQLRINNASQLVATRLWLSHTTFDGLDVTVGLSRVKPKDLIYFQDFDDATKWVRYRVVSSTNDGAYHDYTVAYDSGPANVPFQKIALRIAFPVLT